MPRTTRTIETANPASSSKRTTGARHAYLGAAGVVVTQSPPWHEAEGIALEPAPIYPPWNDEATILTPTVAGAPWADDENERA